MSKTHELTDAHKRELDMQIIMTRSGELAIAYERIAELETHLATAISARDAAVNELDAVKRELTAAALWNEDSDKTTTPSVQVYVLHQKLIERADDCRAWDRRYEAAIKTLNIVTQHRNELQALCERQARQLAAQMVQV